MLLKWTKRRLKVTLTLLNAVKDKFPETKNFIDDNIEEEW